MYAHNLIPATPSQFVVHGETLADWQSLSDVQRAEIGWLPLIYDPEGALLGYADPVEETRDGQQVAVAYALGTEQARLNAKLASMQAAARAIVASERSRRVDLLVTGKTDDWRGHMRTTAGGSALLALVALGVASEAQEDALVATLALFEQVEAHEAAEALILADITAATTVEQVDSITDAIPTDARWPA